MKKDEVLRAVEEDLFHIIIAMAREGTSKAEEWLSGTACLWKSKGLIEEDFAKSVETETYDWKRVMESRSVQICVEGGDLARTDKPTVDGEGQDVVSGQDKFWLERIIKRVDERLSSPEEPQGDESVTSRNQELGISQQNREDGPTRQSCRDRKRKPEAETTENKKPNWSAKRKRLEERKGAVMRDDVPPVYKMKKFDTKRQPEVRRMVSRAIATAELSRVAGDRRSRGRGVLGAAQFRRKSYQMG